MLRWTRVKGDGLAYEGPCLVFHLAFEAGDSGRYIDVYDGRDATSGKLYQRFKMVFEQTHCINYAVGIPFDRGVYIDAESSEEATTVVFEPI